MDRAELVRRALARYVPAEKVPVADWLDAHRTLGAGETERPGPWRTSLVPYLRGPLEAFTDQTVETVVLLFSSQIAKTEGAILGTLLYSYATDPGPGMLILPTLELAGSVSSDRLAPALNGCEVLAEKLGGNGRKRTTTAILHKRINAAPLTISGSNSASSLSSRPVRYLWCDEIDLWDSAGESGDPLALAIQRTAAFRRRKIVLTSTPTVKGASRIEDWYERSDKRVLEAPCPRCAAPFVVEWHHVRWESGRPETAHLECPACKGRIEDAERGRMFAAATWRATAPFRGIAGFRTWAVVSPFRRLSECVAEFLEAKKQPDTLRAWVNLTRGESWEDPAERVTTPELISRAETGDWWEALPRGIKVLTCGVDTQDDRLEALVVGWGEGEECWLVSRELHPGDPNTDAPWTSLDQTLDQVWKREEGGALRIACTLVDAGGHRTDAVYKNTRARQGRRVFASFGRAGGEQGQLVSPPKQLTTPFGQVTRYILDADAGTALLHARLKGLSEGPGAIHLPSLGVEQLVAELTAEVARTKRNKFGVPVREFVRTGRNESADCFRMALGALRVVAPTAARLEAVHERTKVRT